MIPVIINGDIKIFLHSLFLKTHRIVIINTWHIEATESSVSPFSIHRLAPEQQTK